MSTTTFIEQLYQNFLGREPLQAGIDYWVEQIDTQQRNAAEVTQAFIDSQEFSQSVSPIIQLYYVAFGRIPSQEGLAYWVGRFKGGDSISHISAALVETAEFKGLFSGLDNTAFIQQLYLQAFGREADTLGKVTWIQAMDAGMSRAEVVLAFAQSEEMNQVKGLEIEVLLKYYGILNTAPETQELSTALAENDPEGLITQLYSDIRYTGETVPGLTKQGVAFDGYIEDGLVFIDSNGDGVLNQGELSAQTGTKGQFDFSGRGGFGTIVLSGGRDISTGIAFEGEMTAPGGATIINPLTTILVNLQANGRSTSEQAQTALLTQLGLDSQLDLLNYDSIAESLNEQNTQVSVDIALKTQGEMIKVNLVVSQIAALIHAVDGNLSEAELIAQTYQSLSNWLVNHSNSQLDLSDPSIIADLINQTATNAGLSANDLNTIAGLADSAAEAIGNLNQAVDQAIQSGASALDILTELAAVQIVAEDIENSMEAAVASGNLSSIVSRTQGTTLSNAIDDAKQNVGDVDGDGSPDNSTSGSTPIGGGLTSPILTSSSPSDDSENFTVSSNIELTFDRGIQAGSGNIILSNGSSDTRTIDVTDNSQVSFSGNMITINPSNDLYANTAYYIQMGSGVLQDTNGFVYTGINDTSTLNFKTQSTLIELSAIETAGNPLGYVLNGVNANDETASAIANIGDINGDGLDDQIISARIGTMSKSAIFVAYGKTDGTMVELSDVEAGTGGFVINGVNTADKSGHSVNGAGDVNGDGIADIIVGDPDGSTYGVSYLVFGKTNNNPIELSDVGAGTGGFIINGGSLQNEVGFSVSGGGDINRDGLDDLIIGAPFSQANGNNSGKSFVVFGKTDTNAVDLFSIDSSTNGGGFAIDGVATGDLSGISVDNAGDVNGDGFADVLVGAMYDSPNGNHSGAGFVVFGKTDGTDIELSDIETGTGGFVINGQSIDDRSGWKLSGGGDVNGDGFDDLLISAVYADPNGNKSGAAYLIFGKTDGNIVELSNVTAGTGGFAIHGSHSGDFAGADVEIVGDVNGDGLEDILVGASNASPNGSSSGSSYLIFGKTDSNTVELSDVENATGGFVNNGVSAQDFSGKTVSAAGDVNGDGFADLLIGATDDDPNGSESGSAFILFGGQNSAATIGSTGDDSIIGNLSADQIIAGAGNDTLTGNGGADVLSGGSGNDILSISDVNFNLINGGNGIDTLRLSSKMIADLTTINQNQISGIEIIDLNGTASTLKLGRDNILSLVGIEAANDLRINGTSADTLNLSQSGFYNSGSTTVIDSTTYWIYLADASLNIDDTVRLLVDIDLNVTTAVVELSALEDSINESGFVINGLAADDKSSHAVSNLGDVNGDGLDDFFVSAHRHDTNGSNSGSSFVVFGKADGAAVELTDIRVGNGGFVINGVSEDDKASRSLSGVGDVNGDGLADMLIGAHRDDPNGNNSGAAIVVFGKTDTNTVELSDVQVGTGGFVMNGVSEGDRAGRWVSWAGDVNGDGFDDLLVGARGDDNNGSDSGSTFLVFGKSDGTAVELSDVEAGTGGFIMNGPASDDFSGTSTGGGGDINGDGLEDLIIGAIGAAPHGPYSGGAFVVFGKTDTTSVELTDVIGGTGGFFMAGVSPGDFAGRSVSNAGDVNGDGLDDVIVGAWYDDPNGNGSGASFVVFGKTDGNVVELTDIEAGTGGFVINGANAYDSAGGSVSNAGDINGDGLDDLIVGADYASPNGTYSGAAYVVYGKTDTTAVELSNVDDGVGGFVINGASAGDFTGHSVSSGGDINGDGFDDLIVGAYGDDLHGDLTGTGFVIYGGFDSAATVGSSGIDTLAGNSSANQLVAGQGNDILIGSGGADVLRGGAGNDILAISDSGFKILSGGTGTDTLRLDAALTLDFRNISNTITDSIEIINLTGDGGNSTLSFNITDIIQFNESQTAANNLIIQGDTGDVVNLYDVSNGQTGTWAHAGGGVYEFTAGVLGVIGTVTIDTDITTNIL